MKVNNIDIRKYNAKQLTVNVQPPDISVNYGWIEGAALPVEFKTDVKMGHLKLSVYFMGKNRSNIIRSVSELMMNFTKACVMELDGYKGYYRGFLVSSDYEKKKVKTRYILNLEFDGYFYDDELEVVFDEKTDASFYRVGTRDTPCVVEVLAKSDLTNYEIRGLGDDVIKVESLQAGKTVIINGINGLITMDGASAFDVVDIWELPVLVNNKIHLVFSNEKAKVTIRYMPMWI